MRAPGTGDWLAPFVDRLRAAGPDALEIGCGSGLDAAYLADRGFSVVALDRRDPGWASARRPRVGFLRADVRHLPIRDASAGVAVASLSLHYLPWVDTLAAFAAAAHCLRPGGVFVFRVNASDDYNHGAGQGEEVESGFFLQPPGTAGWSDTKRFFSEDAVRAALPSSLTIEHLAHRTIHRYELPKQVWECLAAKRP